MLLRKWIRDWRRRAEERQTLWVVSMRWCGLGVRNMKGEWGEDVHDADAENDE